MSRFYSHINTSLRILRTYNGEVPFSIFLRQFFSSEKKYGSKDRKQISALCYAWFRLGIAFKKQLTEQNLLHAFFIISNQSSALIEALMPERKDDILQPPQEKIRLLQFPFQPEDIFPYKTALSNGINPVLFNAAFMQQPDLFIRIRPQHQQQALQKIKSAGIVYQLLNYETAVRFPQASNIENILQTDREVVIQDYQSQQVLNYLQLPGILSAYKNITAWDCCAASGGKSILLYDHLKGKLELTVSDIRKSILDNLQVRFKKAGIKKYRQFVSDSSGHTTGTQFDIIICDAPCTGSGTWGRTPEQLYFFDTATIDRYATQQQQIAVNTLSSLKNNGLLFYITCSVFKKENEDVADHILQQKGMQLLEMKNLPGYTHNSDSMFVAVFKKHD